MGRLLLATITFDGNVYDQELSRLLPERNAGHVSDVGDSSLHRSERCCQESHLVVPTGMSVAVARTTVGNTPSPLRRLEPC
jgi:hypothetical protein